MLAKQRLVLPHTTAHGQVGRAWAGPMLAHLGQGCHILRRSALYGSWACSQKVREGWLKVGVADVEAPRTRAVCAHMCGNDSLFTLRA